MAELNIEAVIKSGVEKALNKSIIDGKSITEWAAIGMKAPRWLSVKDRLPKEHPSIFAEMYGTEKWRSGMWRTESDRVLVTIKFPDNTRTVDKGRLQDGAWRTGVSPVLPQEVTHWAVWPEPAEEEMQK